ncbi:MAG: NTP transferase domain-containing protein [Acetatifactor muris]|nr:NTP transferase domain-containing protein [Acetatifactor muris]MCM1526649.1 NTP transferase domain-containing protein [Bacteroides sp.]
MKTVAFVPIKTNNERLPGKNTRCFSNGRPMIEYILETLSTVKKIDEIYVYCSDMGIKEYLPDGVKFLERDPYYDLSTTGFNEVLASFADLVAADIYVLAHATAPFISEKTITAAVNALMTGEYDSALAVRKEQEFVWKDGKPFNYDVERIPRTQDLEPFYIETCGMYVYSSQLIKEKKRRIGDRPFLVEVSKVEACDVNTLEDFEFADMIAMRMETRADRQE